MTCSIGYPAAALIAIRCRTPSVPVEPIAMNTVRIPASASVRSRGSSRRVGTDVQPAGFAENRDRGFARVQRGDRIAAREYAPRTIPLPTRRVRR